jgi:imidazolonepropionase-like amidohydrolase
MIDVSAGSWPFEHRSAIIAGMQPAPPPVLFANASLLDPLRDELLEGHHVLVEDGLVKEVSDRPLQAAAARTIDLAGRTLMPGLIDLHVHVLATQLDLVAQTALPDALVTMRAVPLLAAMLRRGFTTVRDAGGAGYGLKCAVAEGTVAGPRLYVSGHALSQTGGHGDTRARSDFLRPVGGCGCLRAGALARVVDGVDAVRRAVREELQMGADQIKIMASGGIASPTDPIAAWGYADDEIAAIVHEATARQTYVMAHAYSAEAIERVVRLGVRTIEHGNLVDERVAALMAARGAVMVPTLVTYEALAREGVALGLPPESAAKIEAVGSAGLRALEICRRAGVRIGFGTDLLGASQRLQLEELRIRAAVQPPLEIIRSATIVGAEVLGMTGRLGRLVPAAHADALVVDGNPLRDLSCLWGAAAGPALVMKGGAIHHEQLAGR